MTRDQAIVAVVGLCTLDPFARIVLAGLLLHGRLQGAGEVHWDGSLTDLAALTGVSERVARDRLALLGAAPGRGRRVQISLGEVLSIEPPEWEMLDATGTAQDAVRTAYRAVPTAHRAVRTAYRAVRTAHGAVRTAYRAVPTAQDAVTDIAASGTAQDAVRTAYRAVLTAPNAVGTLDATRGRSSLSGQILDQERDVVEEREVVRERTRTSAPPARPSPATLTPPSPREPLGHGALRTFDDTWCRITGHLVAKPAAVEMLLACLTEFGGPVLTEALVRLETWANENPGRPVNPVWVRERCQQVVADRQRQGSNPPRGQQRFAGGRRRADPIPSRESWNDPQVLAGWGPTAPPQDEYEGPFDDDDAPVGWGTPPKNPPGTGGAR